MTTSSYHGANYTVIDNLPGVGSFVRADEWGGDVKAITDTFTATSADTGTFGSFIYIGTLPKGAVPLNVIVSANNSITWSGTIGYSGVPDALGDFPVLGVSSAMTGPSAAVGSTALSAAKDIYITTVTQTIASGDSITTTIFYIQGA